MKFGTIAGLLSVATAADLTAEADNALEEQDYEMQQKCANMGEISNENDLDLDEGEDEDKKKFIKRTKGSYKKHYGRTKAQIDKENNHIVKTQATCLKFVKKYNKEGHPKVCNWCKKAKAPKIVWKWDKDDHVWFRWYQGKWHYWGPSKHGFTSAGWTWYKGYWHHNGWVFKYVKHVWYRFQGRHWVKYGKKIDISPKVPHEPKICRPFYMLKKFGFPSSLGIRSLPRCKVGTGKQGIWYMWKDRANCKFLGGKLVYQKIKTCKTGRPHQWVKVTRCVRGPVMDKTGLDYKTGLAKRQIIKDHYIGGMKIGGCYKLRSYAHSSDYFSNRGTYAFNSPTSKINVWKIGAGMDGAKNTVTIYDRTGRYGARLYSKNRVRFYWNKWLSKKSATMTVYKGLMHTGVSFSPAYKKGYFLKHEKVYRKATNHQIFFAKYNGKFAFRKAATWYPIKAKC